jgi:hypothetical protein
VDKAILEQQLSSVVDQFRVFQSRSPHNDLSNLPKEDRQALVSRAIAAIYRISGNDSTYSKDVNRLLQAMPSLHVHTTSILGVAQALLDDVRAGYLQTVIEIVHADIFSDFLEMAQHLCETGYKDASAVIAGSTLEGHIRGLCQKAQIPTEIIKNTGDAVAKKADGMNSELAAAGVYSKLDQKNITAWLDLRNQAAHGKYDNYSKEQVVLLIAGIRDFIARHPA